MKPFNSYRAVWVFDTEFTQVAGGHPIPICLVAKELLSNTTIRLRHDQFIEHPPFGGKDELVVAFSAAGDFGCFLALGWHLPANVVDLYAEHRVLTNGQRQKLGDDLVSAAISRGIGNVPMQKSAMRNLAVRGSPFSGEEMRQLLDYCEQDVITTAELFLAIAGQIDWPRAQIRGDYIKAVAEMERRGVPIDSERRDQLTTRWPEVCERLVADTPGASGVFKGRNLQHGAFARFIDSLGISEWPRTNTGQLSTSEETFEAMSLAHPDTIAPIAKLHKLMPKVGVSKLAVGPDGRNRAALKAFGQLAGRNNPSLGEFIFGHPSPLRALITPASGWALSYIDWERQEFGIVAALSGDAQMLADYNSGDPYMAFAKRAGRVPPWATRETHPEEREQAKQVVLGMNYGMTAYGLALRLRITAVEAEFLIQQHKRAYPDYWNWVESAVDYALLQGRIHSSLGWQRHVSRNAEGQVNLRSLQNFPAQANGAEMLRLACIFAIEDGIRACAPVHDALLIEAPDDDLEHAIGATQRHMARASELVLGGFQLQSEVKTVRTGERLIDPRGAATWQAIEGLLNGRRSDGRVAPTT